jgi:hypothetical protein
MPNDRDLYSEGYETGFKEGYKSKAMARLLLGLTIGAGGILCWVLIWAWIKWMITHLWQLF